MPKSLLAGHTKPGCKMNPTYVGNSAWDLGSNGQIANNCDVNAAGQWANQGCAQTSKALPAGTAFNNVANGGVVALEWDLAYGFKQYYFPRTSVPADITSGTPNPATWGTPSAALAFGTTCPTNYFNNMRMILNICLCGGWAGDENVWNQYGCPAATGYSTVVTGTTRCAQYVRSVLNQAGAEVNTNTYTHFTEAYFELYSIKVYDYRLAPTCSNGNSAQR